MKKKSIDDTSFSNQFNVEAHSSSTLFDLILSYQNLPTQICYEKNIFNIITKCCSEEAINDLIFNDQLQLIINHLPLFAYFDHSTAYYFDNIDKLFCIIDKNLMEITSLCNNCLLNEQVSLIKAVLNYQTVNNGVKALVEAETLLNIQGEIFTNSITQCVYYDYFGLEYQKKALNILISECDINGYVFSPDSLDAIFYAKLSPQTYDKVTFFLQESIRLHKKVLDIVPKDIVWNSYIRFNMARTLFIIALISKECHTLEWEKCLSDAISYRELLVTTISQNTSKEFFLKDELTIELWYAKLLFATLRKYTKSIEVISPEEVLEIKNIEKILNQKVHNNNTISKLKCYIDYILK